MSPDQRIPGWFIAVFVLAFLLIVGIGIWRVTLARKMARDAGLSPSIAAAVTMFSRDGIGAAYLASTLNLQARRQPSETTRPPKTAEQRLEELAALRDKDLITQDEYDSRRQAILGSI